MERNELAAEKKNIYVYVFISAWWKKGTSTKRKIVT